MWLGVIVMVACKYAYLNCKHKKFYWLMCEKNELRIIVVMLLKVMNSTIVLN
jgi:hypothetical protein